MSLVLLLFVPSLSLSHISVHGRCWYSLLVWSKAEQRRLCGPPSLRVCYETWRIKAALWDLILWSCIRETECASSTDTQWLLLALGTGGQSEWTMSTNLARVCDALRQSLCPEGGGRREREGLGACSFPRLIPLSWAYWVY